MKSNDEVKILDKGQSRILGYLTKKACEILLLRIAEFSPMGPTIEREWLETEVVRSLETALLRLDADRAYAGWRTIVLIDDDVLVARLKKPLMQILELAAQEEPPNGQPHTDRKEVS